MQTITDNSNTSFYIFDDGVSIEVQENSIKTPNFDIGDLNQSNSTVHTDVTPPADWMGGKYFFDGTTWTLDTNWVHPIQDEINGLTAQINMLKARIT